MSSKSIEEVIEKIKTIPFDYANHGQLISLYKEIGLLGILANPVPAGTRIIRATINEDQNASLRNVKRMGVRKASEIPGLGRVHLPHEPTFYGVIDKPIEPPEILLREGLGRAFSMFEISNLIDSGLDGEERITYGPCKTTKDLELISIFASEYFLKVEKHFVNQLEDYRKRISAMDGQNSQWETVLKFFSDEYAKEIANDDGMQYLKSASFSSHIRSLNLKEKYIDGIIYPSVKSRKFEGSTIGLNVSLFENCFPQKIRLDTVVECLVYKKGENYFVDNEKMAIIHPGAKEFYFGKSKF